MRRVFASDLKLKIVGESRPEPPPTGCLLCMDPAYYCTGEMWLSQPPPEPSVDAKDTIINTKSWIPDPEASEFTPAQTTDPVEHKDDCVCLDCYRRYVGEDQWGKK